MSSGLSKLATALVCLSISTSSSKTTTTAFTPPASSIHSSDVHSANTPTTTSSLCMSFTDVSNFYADFPLQAAVLTCGVKASVADGIAQARPAIKQQQQQKLNDDINDQENPTFIDFSTLSTNYSTSSWIDDLEFRRNVAYIIYGGIFIGALCHYEYDVLFPILFGTNHNLVTSIKEVLFDNFVTAPIVWLPPAYFVKAIMYNYSLTEGLNRYSNDITKNGLLKKYWTVWLPAQSVSFTVVPDHLRVVFMACVSFFWFILFSTVSSNASGSSGDGELE